MVGVAEEYNDNLGELLPEVIFLDILSRLSIKTLSRFKCVSKSWNQLISRDISFHMLHREKSIMKEPCVLFIDGRSYGTMTFTSSDPSINYTCTLPVGNMFCITSICCDLFCFATGWDIFLCNPSMRRVHTLPRSKFTSNPNPLIHLEEHIIGFGYITSKRLYIVVNLIRALRPVVNEDWDGQAFSEMNPFYPGNAMDDNSEGEVLCEMYTFCPDTNIISPSRSSSNHLFSCPYYPYGSSWRAINDVCPRWVDRKLNGLMLNTSMYWLIERYTICFVEFSSVFSTCERKNNELILSLDIETEKFEIICCPPGWEWESPESEQDDVSISLVDLKGTLCVANASFVRTSVLEIWARTATNDDSEGGSSQTGIWVKEYSIKMDIPLPSLEVYRPLIHPAASRKGEILLASPVLNEFYIFNVDKECIVREVCGPFEGQVPVALGFCWESFLTL